MASVIGQRWEVYNYEPVKHVMLKRGEKVVIKATPDFGEAIVGLTSDRKDRTIESLYKDFVKGVGYPFRTSKDQDMIDASEIAARIKGDADTLAAAKQHTNDTVNAKPEWLTAVNTTAELPKTGLDSKQVYLCPVVADPVKSGTYILRPGAVNWELFSTLVDFVNEQELASAVSTHNTSATAHPDIRADIVLEAEEREKADSEILEAVETGNYRLWEAWENRAESLLSAAHEHATDEVNLHNAHIESHQITLTDEDASDTLKATGRDTITSWLQSFRNNFKFLLAKIAEINTTTVSTTVNLIEFVSALPKGDFYFYNDLNDEKNNSLFIGGADNKARKISAVISGTPTDPGDPGGEGGNGGDPNDPGEGGNGEGDPNDPGDGNGEGGDPNDPGDGGDPGEGGEGGEGDPDDPNDPGDPALPPLTGVVHIISTSISYGAGYSYIDLVDVSGLNGEGEISYTWQRNGVDIEGAVLNIYATVPEDANQEITLTVTRSGYAGSVVSNALIFLPRLTGSIAVIGEPVVGNTLSVDVSGLNGEGKISYTWQRNGSILSNASTYTLTEADEGKTVWVHVTRPGYAYKVDADPITVVTPAPPVPVMTISPDQSFILSALTGSVNVSGTASSELNLIYLWERVSGTGTIDNPNSLNTSITELSVGTSEFRLTVTDEKGQSVSMTTTITANLPDAPTANAGGNKSIQLPTNSVTLSGSGTGTGITYSWERVSGSGSISSPSSAGTNITGLGQGSSVYRLTATDLWGRTATSDAAITVEAEVVAPPPVTYGLQEFDFNGTFTVPAGVTRLRITACAAGGSGSKQGAGGGGAQFIPSDVNSGVYSVVPGQSIPITVGSGNTVIGSLVSLNKGGNASGSTPGTSGGHPAGSGGSYGQNGGNSLVASGGNCGTAAGAGSKGPGGGGASLGPGGNGGNDLGNNSTPGQNGTRGGGGGGCAPTPGGLVAATGGLGYVKIEWNF